MVIADTLSRAHIPYTPSDDLEENLDCAVHMVLEKCSATDKGLQNVRKTQKQIRGRKASSEQNGQTIELI